MQCRHRLYPCRPLLPGASYPLLCAPRPTPYRATGARRQLRRRLTLTPTSASASCAALCTAGEGAGCRLHTRGLVVRGADASAAAAPTPSSSCKNGCGKLCLPRECALWYAGAAALLTLLTERVRDGSSASIPGSVRTASRGRQRGSRSRIPRRSPQGARGPACLPASCGCLDRICISSPPALCSDERIERLQRMRKYGAWYMPPSLWSTEEEPSTTVSAARPSSQAHGHRRRMRTRMLSGPWRPCVRPRGSIGARASLQRASPISSSPRPSSGARKHGSALCALWLWATSSCAWHVRRYVLEKSTRLPPYLEDVSVIEPEVEAQL
jgi:hypothetical protein